MSELTAGTPVARGYEAAPADEQKGPGVLVLHAWWGLNGFFRELCDRLAAEGFVAVAPDLWGGAVATTEEQAQALLNQRDDAAIYEAVNGALEYLRTHPQVEGEQQGAIGFSMGAAWALYFAGARPDALAAVTLFYGAGEADFAVARCAFQGHFAENDPWEPTEGVRQMEADMRSAGREVDFYFYPGAGHWFFEADRPDAYDYAAADEAWQRTLSFLARLKVEG